MAATTHNIQEEFTCKLWKLFIPIRRMSQSPVDTGEAAGTLTACTCRVHFFFSTALLFSSALITPISLPTSADLSGARSSCLTTYSRE
jgi:hypothetical protein